MKKGFTLVELLVVITIIGILPTLASTPLPLLKKNLVTPSAKPILGKSPTLLKLTIMIRAAILLQPMTVLAASKVVA